MKRLLPLIGIWLLAGCNPQPTWTLISENAEELRFKLLKEGAPVPASEIPPENRIVTVLLTDRQCDQLEDFSLDSITNILYPEISEDSSELVFNFSRPDPGCAFIVPGNASINTATGQIDSSGGDGISGAAVTIKPTSDFPSEPICDTETLATAWLDYHDQGKQACVDAKVVETMDSPDGGWIAEVQLQCIQGQGCIVIGMPLCTNSGHVYFDSSPTQCVFTVELGGLS